MTRAIAVSKSGGFSLLELMISIVLGLLLIAGATATYLASKRSYTEVEQFSSLTENARFAELTMADALLHAGFFGAAPAASIILDPSNPAPPPNPAADCGGRAVSIGNGKTMGAADVYNVRRYVYGATIDGSGVAVADGVDLDCINDGREGTDVLIIKRAIPRPLTDGLRDVEDPVLDGVLNHPNLPQAHTIYVLSNNKQGRLFDGSGTQPGIMVGDNYVFATAWPYQFEAYYIRDVDPNSELDPPILARKTLVWNGTAMVLQNEDLIEGVEEMRLQIAFDNVAGTEVGYSKVSDMVDEDWARVSAVEVYLLVRSSTKDPQFKDTKTYYMGGDVTDDTNFITRDEAGEVDPNNDKELRVYRRLRVMTQASLRNPNLILQRGAG